MRSPRPDCASKNCPGKASANNPFCRKHSKIDQAERAQRIEAEQFATRQAVAAGCCPKCGSDLRHNLSISGWIQCAQLGAVTHRADPNKPACDWQGFTH